MIHRRRLAVAAMALALLVLGAITAHRYLEAAAFVARAAHLEGIAAGVARHQAVEVTVSETPVAWREGELRGRTYQPVEIDGRAVLLLPGVHAAGIDEPRLVTFAREIAATGHPVVTVELPDLAGYRITPRSTDMIEDAARHVAAAWAPRMRESDRAIGIAGISFAGGLSVVAASRLDGTAAWVLSLGGHGDLPRTLRYLCGAELPAGARPPHDYGVVIILLELAGKLVPAGQVDPLLHGVRTFLEASHLDMVDKAASAQTFESARRLAAALPEPARTVMGWVNERDVGRLGKALLPHISSMGLDPALSPERNPPPAMPVHLLHGADDNVVPSAETASLAAYLEARGADVAWLTTPLITHAEVDRGAAAGEIWRLVRFWAALL